MPLRYDGRREPADIWFPIGLKLGNNEVIAGLNAAGTAFIDIIKLNTSDQIELGPANVVANNAAGPAFASNEAATSTNPTLIPNKAEMDTGFGWASDVLHFVLGGASYGSIAKTVATFADDVSVGDDLLLPSSGAIVNFNAGDITITHSVGKLTLDGDGAVEIDFNNHEMTRVDINSGDISGVTISGGLTWSASQNFATGTTAIATVDINAGNIDGVHIGATTAALSMRVDDSGLAVQPTGDDDANLLYVNVTGTPILSWDESDDRFTFSHGIDIDAGDLILASGGNVGIGIVPLSALHIKASYPGTIGDNPAGQLNIQSPTDDVNTSVVITAYKSNAGGDPDVQLWYLGSTSSSGNANITFLNRRNASLSLATNDINRLIVSGAGEATFTSAVVLNSTLVLGGDVTVGENSLILDHAIGTDQKWSGITCEGTAGETIDIGELCYLQDTDNEWLLVDADAEASCAGMLGIAITAGTNASSFRLLLLGFMREDTLYQFATGGGPLYASVTPGAISATAPVAAGDIVRVIGYAHDDVDTIYFNPDGAWVEIAA